MKKYQSGKRNGVVIMLVALFGIFPVGSIVAAEQHPELKSNEMYVACADCHKEATPEVFKQWYSSVHGIAMVKCYQCHGTFETFRLTPTRENCAVCHKQMVDKCPVDKDCWQCHTPHAFTRK